MGRYVPRPGWAEQKTSRERCCGKTAIHHTCQPEFRRAKNCSFALRRLGQNREAKRVRRSLPVSRQFIRNRSNSLAIYEALSILPAEAINVYIGGQTGNQNQSASGSRLTAGPSRWFSSPGGSMRSRSMILLAIAVVGGVAGAQALANSNTASTPGRTEIRLTYLGNAGWEITDGKTYVLTDPFISEFRSNREAKPGQVEPPPMPSLEDTFTPDAEGIDAKIHRADYIIITGTQTTHLTPRTLRKKPGRRSSGEKLLQTLPALTTCRNCSSLRSVAERITISADFL
jgi:hypothetical protein